MIALLVALATLPPAPARGFILDEAGVLSVGEREVLNRQIKAISDRGAGQVGILLTDDLRGKTRNQLAPEVFKAWGIGYGDRGATGRGRGVLILAKAHPPDRGVRVEVGQDLEGRLTDGKVGAITRDSIPDFAAGRWHDGLVRMVYSLAVEMYTEAADVAAPMRPAVVKSEGIGEWIWLFTGIPALALVGVWVYFRKRRRVPPPRQTPMPPLPPDEAPARLYPSLAYEPPIVVAVPTYSPPVVVEHRHTYEPSYSAPDPSPSSDSGSSWGSSDSGSSWGGSDSGGGSFGGGGDSSGGGSDSSF